MGGRWQVIEYNFVFSYCRDSVKHPEKSWFTSNPMMQKSHDAADSSPRRFQSTKILSRLCKLQDVHVSIFCCYLDCGSHAFWIWAGHLEMVFVTVRGIRLLQGHMWKIGVLWGRWTHVKKKENAVGCRGRVQGWESVCPTKLYAAQKKEIPFSGMFSQFVALSVN